MEIFDALLAGFATAITPANLLWALVGCALGTCLLYTSPSPRDS